MTTDQATMFAILAAILGLLIWGRWRYDLVAFAALVLCLLLGLVPTDEAFSGFGHPATVIIALVLVVSAGLSASGAVELLAQWALRGQRSLTAHIAATGMLAAALSAVMNNVAALALLMPVDLQAAKVAKRTGGLTLMPLSFAAILGGIVTLIGTPPNIIVSAYRSQVVGEPYHMFDFAPVGLCLALIGLVYIALIGWRLIPRRGAAGAPSDDFLQVQDYVAELLVPAKADGVGKTWTDVRTVVEKAGGQLLGLVRGGKRVPVFAEYTKAEPGDLLIVQAAPEELEAIVATLGLEYPSAWSKEDLLRGGEVQLAEAVLPQDAPAIGQSASSLNIGALSGIRLLGLARQGRLLRQRVRHERLKPGDVLLLLGPAKTLADAVARLGGLMLAGRGLQMVQREKAGMAAALFAAAILAATFGLVPLPVALSAVVVAYLAFGVLPPSKVYTSIEWPVIVLLGAMIPIGRALETTGATGLIADNIVRLTAGQEVWVILALLMAVTMTISDVINNTATAVMVAPVAMEVASRLNASPDPFLMAVAIAASCAFLTPIGHQNNLLILGPGGYRFGDYWRMGLPLEILIIAAGVPLLLLFWPV